MDVAAGAVTAGDEVAEVEVTGAVAAGLPIAGALAKHSVASALANIALPHASRNTRFIASFPTASIIVEELGRRVNSD